MNWFNKSNIEWAVSLWVYVRGNRLPRVALILVVAAVGLASNVFQLIVYGAFAFLGQKLPMADTPWWAVALMTIVAALLLVVDRIVPERVPMPNKHDVSLYEEFKKLFDNNMMYFLRTHDFGNGFERSFFDPLNTLSAVWVGTRYEFDDKKVREIWDELFPTSRKLVRLMALNTTPEGPDMIWAKPWWKDHDVMPDRAWTAINEMNDASDRLLELIDKLDAAARAKGLSSGPHALGDEAA